MWRLSDAELNCVRTKIRADLRVEAVLIGMSIRRYLPPIGTAGFDRELRERKEPRTPAAAEDDGEHVVHRRSLAFRRTEAQYEERPHRAVERGITAAFRPGRARARAGPTGGVLPSP